MAKRRKPPEIIRPLEIVDDRNQPEETWPPDRVKQTIDRLISNLPETIEYLRFWNLTSLACQLQNDLDNLVYWQREGGLAKKICIDKERE